MSVEGVLRMLIRVQKPKSEEVSRIGQTALRRARGWRDRRESGGHDETGVR